MVVNGFTRLSAPQSFDDGKFAGFYTSRDFGVPYMNDILYSGAQYEFRRNIPWTDDDDPGFGASRADHETQVIAGNTFDYPYVHGVSIAAAGYSFISSSLAAYAESSSTGDYKVVDLILGKQRTTVEGRGVFGAKYNIYPEGLRRHITADTKRGVGVIVTGAYVGSDLWDNPKATGEDRTFAKSVLGYAYRSGLSLAKGEIDVVQSRFAQFRRDTFKYTSRLNSDCYAVESPDCIFAADEKASATVMRYGENNATAAIAVNKGSYRTFIAGFPFETITDASSRDGVMAQILEFLTSKTTKQQKK